MYPKRPLPEAISHRGLRANAPENTIPAFLDALTAGAEAIELDVHASADGTVFVHHDFHFLDADGVRRDFRETDSREIASAKIDGNVAIPSLDAVLEAIGIRARVYIEVKARGIESDVVRCLRRHFVDRDNYAVHAFDHRVVKRVLSLMPSARTGILQVAYPIDTSAAMRAAGASDLWQQADFIDSTLVADVHAYGGRIVAWTANDPTQWQTLSELGVDGICTDRVDAYVQWRDR